MATIATASPLLDDTFMPAYPDDQAQAQDASIITPITPSTPVSEEALVPEGFDDTDSEHDNELSPRPQHVTQRRRLQNSIFSAWYEWAFLPCRPTTLTVPGSQNAPRR